MCDKAVLKDCASKCHLCASGDWSAKVAR